MEQLFVTYLFYFSLDTFKVFINMFQVYKPFYTLNYFSVRSKLRLPSKTRLELHNTFRSTNNVNLTQMDLFAPNTVLVT